MQSPWHSAIPISLCNINTLYYIILLVDHYCFNYWTFFGTERFLFAANQLVFKRGSNEKEKNRESCVLLHYFVSIQRTEGCDYPGSSHLRRPSAPRLPTLGWLSPAQMSQESPAVWSHLRLLRGGIPAHSISLSLEFLIHKMRPMPTMSQVCEH